jgi:3-oxoacyl-[acyl-carrier-protein] synthase III
MKIVAIEKYLPPNCVYSVDLDKRLGIPAGHLEKLTGVKNRYQITEGEQSVTDLGANALKLALKKAHLQASDIDLLIATGAIFDYPVPNNSTLIKSKITDDSTAFPCFDVDSTCLSFLNGLDIAHLYLQSGRYKRIAIVSAEITSIGLSEKDEKTFGLFGDAAVAMIVENNTEGYTPSFTHFVNYPSGAMLATMPVGGVMNRGRTESPTSEEYCFKMDGKKLIRLTTQHLEGFIAHLENQTKLKLSDFDALITHQTSKYGNEYFLRHFGLDSSKVINTLTDYGNCVSASIPLGLEKYFNENKANLAHKKILILGAAAGVSLGCMVLEF